MRKRILLLELSAEKQQSIKQVLSPHYDCQFSTLRDYLQQATQISPDIIIVDDNNPSHDFIETVIRQLSRYFFVRLNHSSFILAPLLVWLAENSNQREQLFQQGAFDYFCTPLIAEECLNRVEQALVRSLCSAKKKTLVITTEQKNQLANENDTFKKFNSDEKSYIEQALAAKAADYILKNLTQEITLNELAANMGTNRTKLSLVFKAYYGVAIFNWIRQQRMQQAALLLSTTSTTILQVAERVGYYDPNNFSTAFKREFQFSPKQYRNQGMMVV